MNRKEKIESITQHEDRNKLDWDDNVLVQPEEGEGSGKNGTERKHFKMSLRKLAPDTDWSEPTDDTPPSGKLVKDSLEQIELTPGPQGIQGEEGDSAYEVAVKEGFVGNETAWLASLKGADGEQGADGVQGPPGNDGAKGADGEKGDDGLSAYEVAVEEGFVGDETAWLASLKGADGQDGAKGADGEQGEEGKSAYDIYVETTSDSPVKTEEQWLASLKGADGEQGADGDSAYDVAVSEGFSGTEQEWLESLKGADGAKGADGVVVIGSASQVSAGLADESWEEITADNEAWISFWEAVRLFQFSVRFLKGEYEIPTNIYFGENSDGPFAIPCGVAKIEGAGEDTVIKVGYPAGGTAFLSATKYDGSNHAPCHISNLKIVNTGMTTFGVVTEVEGSSGSVVENVIVEDMIAVGILASWDVKNVTFRNCTAINCGRSFAGEEAAGIAVLEVDNRTPSNIKIDGCTVIGGAYAGIGMINAVDCKVVNCHVEGYGKIGAGAIGGIRNIFANNTIIRSIQANPQSGEFGLLLNETDRAIVTGNIVENAHIMMDNYSNDCVIENNIGDVATIV